MNNGRQNVSRLEEALYRTYRAKSAGDRAGDGESPDQGWQMETMRRIRAAGPLDAGQDFFAFFEAIVWRLAPVAVALLIATGTGALQLDLTAEIEIAALMDPIGFDFIYKLGIM